MLQYRYTYILFLFLALVIIVKTVLGSLSDFTKNRYYIF